MSALIVMKCLLASSALALAACGRATSSGPPAIQYGQDACSGCGMIVSDDRFAAALVNPAPDSAPSSVSSPLVFDDVGCLLAYEGKNPSVALWKHYFHDAASHQWITADEALFIKTDRETPMGSGIFACRSRSEAEALARSTRGMIQNYAELSHGIATASATRE